MAIFVDPASGKKYEVPDDDNGAATAKWGLVPQEQFQHDQDVQQAGEASNPIDVAGRAADRVVGGAVSGVENLVRKYTGLGNEPGLQEGEDNIPAHVGGAGMFPKAYDQPAMLEREAHPYEAGIGTAIGAAPLAGAAAALAPAAPAGLAAVGAGAAVNATAQEYDDAWLEQRPMQLRNVAAYTAMFSAMDLGFMAAGKVAKGGLSALLGSAPEPGLSLGSGNMVSEAQYAAREAAGDAAHAGGSVGAARAADIEEPFHAGIDSMTDKDAAVLARDSEDHIHLAAQSSADAFTRINQGLSEDLGNQLKYQDYAEHAKTWEPETLDKQNDAYGDIFEKADDIAEQLAQHSEGDKNAFDFGNLGKRAIDGIEGFTKQIGDETDPARRAKLLDEFKKSGDRLMMQADAAHSSDPMVRVTSEKLKELIRPLYGADGLLRKTLEREDVFPGLAPLQKDLNRGWHQFLEHWPLVQRNVLEATGHIAFDTSGAGRITKESTIEKMLGLYNKDPRVLSDFGKHLGGALDGLTDMIEARESYGIVQKDGLTDMRQAVKNVMGDYNVATTVGVARNITENVAKDPRKWKEILAQLAHHVPGVGGLAKAAHMAEGAFGDLNIEKGTPLEAALNSEWQRYAQHPSWQDPSIAANYKPWVRDAIAARGTPIPPAPPGAAAAVAGPGIVNASPSEAYQRGMQILDKRRGQAGAVVIDGALKRSPGTSLLKDAFATADRKGMLSELTEHDLEKLIGVDVLPHEDVPEITEVGNGVRIKTEYPMEFERAIVRAPNGDLVAKHYVFILPDDLRGQGLAKQYLRDTVDVYKKLGVDRIEIPLAVTDGVVVWPKLGATGGDPMILELAGKKGLPNDSLESVARAKGGPAFLERLADREPQMFSELELDVSDLDRRLRRDNASSILSKRGGQSGAVVIGGDGKITSGPKKFLSEAQRVADTGVVGKSLTDLHALEGVERTTVEGLKKDKTFLETGNVKDNFGSSDAGLPRFILDTDGKLKLSNGRHRLTAAQELGKETIQGRIIAYGPRGGEKWTYNGPIRINESKEAGFANMAGGIAKSPMGAAIGLGAVGLGGAAALHDRPTPEQQAPEPAYRTAMADISRAGDQHISSVASDFLRSTVSGKSVNALTQFSGRKSPSDAIEQARSALDKVGSDPMAIVRQISSGTGDLSRTHPGVYQAIVQKAVEVNAYLKSVAPPRVGVTILNSRGAPVPLDQAFDFASRYLGATRPKQTMTDIARATATPEQAESFQANWPELWAGLQSAALGAVQKRYAAGRPLDSEKLRKLDSLLGMNGQLDVSASPEVTQAMLSAQDQQSQSQQAFAQKAGKPMSVGGVSGGVASSFQTKLGSIAAQKELSP